MGETYIQALAELLLLLVDNTQSEIDFIGLVKIRRHAHDLGKGLFCMFKRAVTVI